MSFDLTLATTIAKNAVNLQPLLVFTINGVPYTFTAGNIIEAIRIGDPGLLIDGTWVIGGSSQLEGQKDYMTLGGNTTTKITQQLQPDKGLGTSVSQMSITLIDKNEEITQIISPSVVVDEILGRECKVQIGFLGTDYPTDYITIFRGIIEDITAEVGQITFNLSSTEQKKRTSIFAKATAELATLISSGGSISTIDLDDATGFQSRVLGPAGTYDSSITYYVKINDEYFSYTGVSGNTLTGVTRNPSPFNFGQQAHAVGDAVVSMIRLQGNGLQLARKLMFSGTTGYFETGVNVTNFERISVTELASNAIFFEGIDVSDEYGIVEGDYITTSGASNGANNVTLKTIASITKTFEGSYIVVNGVTFVEENSSAAMISFRSQWDTLSDGCRMKGFDVDEAEFEYWYSTFLSSFDFDFRLFDTVNVKDFIEQQILRPMGCFSIQRKGRISMGYHIGPIPGSNILVLDEDNIINPSKIKIRRSLSKNFYNTIIFNLEKDVNSGEYLITKTAKDQTSIDDFNVGQRATIISSDGMRDSIQGVAKALQVSNRLLDRYKRGAEYLDNVEIKFGDGFSSEIGDIVILKSDGLSMVNITSGDREATTRIFQVLNKTYDIKNATMSVGLVDTNFSNAARYCLISPSSTIKAGISGTQFTIQSSYASKYGDNEYLKWQKWGRIKVKVRNNSGSISGTAWISNFTGNTVTLESSLGFTPAAGQIMTLDTYNSHDDGIKFAYGFMRTTAPFADGKARYQMI